MNVLNFFWTNFDKKEEEKKRKEKNISLNIIEVNI
jgi:hypothetical protein